MSPEPEGSFAYCAAADPNNAAGSLDEKVYLVRLTIPSIGAVALALVSAAANVERVRGNAPPIEGTRMHKSRLGSVVIELPDRDCIR